MTRPAGDELKQAIFLLKSRGLSRALDLCLRSLPLVEGVGGAKGGDFQAALSSLREALEALRKCAASARPGDPKACTSEARAVYRRALILRLVATGEIRRLARARRAAYACIGLGLPTAALFGFPPLAIALVFLGSLWVHPQFAKLRLASWMVLTSTLLVLAPFLVNAVSYFSQSALSPAEVSDVAAKLGLGQAAAQALLLALLAVSAASLSLGLYALACLFRYRAAFG